MSAAHHLLLLLLVAQLLVCAVPLVSVHKFGGWPAADAPASRQQMLWRCRPPDVLPEERLINWLAVLKPDLYQDVLKPAYCASTSSVSGVELA